MTQDILNHPISQPHFFFLNLILKELHTKDFNYKKMLTLRCPLSWKTHLLSSVKNCSLPDFSCLLPQNIYHQFGIPKSDELFVVSKRIRIRYRHKHTYKSRSHFHGFQILIKKKKKKNLSSTKTCNTNKDCHYYFWKRCFRLRERAEKLNFYTTKKTAIRS